MQVAGVLLLIFCTVLQYIQGPKLFPDFLN